MGSLMAGWNSPKTVNLERNKSFTKEEIDNFWRSHKPSQQHQHQPGVACADGEVAKTPSSFDSPHFIFQETKFPIDLDKAYNTNDWWTRSNCAFLNEPPTEEEPPKSARNYTAQFHVASANKPTPAN